MSTDLYFVKTTIDVLLFHLLLHLLLTHLLSSLCSSCTAFQNLTLNSAPIHNMLLMISRSIFSALNIFKNHSIYTLSVTCGGIHHSALLSLPTFLQMSCCTATQTDRSHTLKQLVLFNMHSAKSQLATDCDTNLQSTVNLN